MGALELLIVVLGLLHPTLSGISIATIGGDSMGIDLDREVPGGRVRMGLFSLDIPR